MRTTLALSTLTPLLLLSPTFISAQQNTPSVAPSSLPKVTTVDPRFQSYNIEMLEVTGGRFWKPYKAASASTAAQRRAPRITHRHEPRPLRLPSAQGPLQPAPPQTRRGTRSRLRPRQRHLGQQHLPSRGRRIPRQTARRLSAASSPALSGRASSTSPTPPMPSSSPPSPPASARATRTASGPRRRPQRLLDLTNSLGGHIAAAEYMNEPTLAMHGRRAQRLRRRAVRPRPPRLHRLHAPARAPHTHRRPRLRRRIQHLRRRPRLEDARLHLHSRPSSPP